jgi:hypothetical protein
MLYPEDPIARFMHRYLPWLPFPRPGELTVEAMWRWLRARTGRGGAA